MHLLKRVCNMINNLLYKDSICCSISHLSISNTLWLCFLKYTSVYLWLSENYTTMMNCTNEIKKYWTNWLLLQFSGAIISSNFHLWSLLSSLFDFALNCKWIILKGLLCKIVTLIDFILVLFRTHIKSNDFLWAMK